MAVRKVGAVAIEAVSDTAGFEKDLEKGLKDAVAEAAKDSSWDPLVAAAGRAGDHSAAAYTFRFKSRASHEFDDRSGFFGIRDTRLFQIFSSAGTAAAGFFSKGFGFAGDLFGQLSKSGGMLSGVFGALSGLTSGGLASLGTFLINAGLLIVAIPLLTAAVFALGAAFTALASTAALLPGLMSGLLVSVLPLVIAFQGFGDAISALTSGDLEKFNETLKGLSPSARIVARELQTLMPFFTTLRKYVQEAFFAELTGSLTAFFKAAGGPLAGGLSLVAASLGNLAAQFLELLSRRETVEFMARLFAAVSEGIDMAGPSLLGFMSAMIALADATLPVITELITALLPSIDAFSKFLTEKAASGELATFLREALSILGSIMGIIKELVLLAGTMFGNPDVQAGAKEFFKDIERILAAINEWFKSPDGQEFLKNLGTLAKDFWNVLELLVFPALVMIVGALAQMLSLFDKIGDAADRLARVPFGIGPTLALLGFGTAADGGITQGPVIAGEAGTEAILPLDDPVRARQIASDPLVQNVLGGTGDTIVYAVFDGEPFQARIVRTTRATLESTSRQLTQKPRTVVG